MVAYGEITGPDRGDAAVHPDYRRRGIGTAIAGWMQQTAKDLGGTGYGSPVPQGSAGDQLLDEARLSAPPHQLGARRCPRGRRSRSAALPEGYAIREAGPTSTRAVHDVIEDAFLEWSVRDRESYDDFDASMIGRPGFEPWNMRVVTDADGVIVGCAQVIMAGADANEAYIDRLAVRSDQRHRGLAQALLVDAFARGREHGAVRSALSHGLAHRRAEPLREGRHGGRRRLGEPRHRRLKVARHRRVERRTT